MSDRRNALTLVEILVVLVCVGLLLGVAWKFWWTSTRYTRDLQERMEQLSAAQVLLNRLNHELTGGRRLLYPAPGLTADGLGILDGDGRAVVYRMDRSAASPRLLREDAAGSRVLFEGLRDCQFKIPDAPPGRDPGLVHVTLVLSGAGARPFPLFTSMRLRAPDVRCPLYR